MAETNTPSVKKYVDYAQQLDIQHQGVGKKMVIKAKMLLLYKNRIG